MGFATRAQVATEARRLATGRIVGVDISPKMVAEARRHAKDGTLQIAYLVGDMITLSGPSGAYSRPN